MKTYVDDVSLAHRLLYKQIVGGAVSQKCHIRRYVQFVLTLGIGHCSDSLVACCLNAHTCHWLVGSSIIDGTCHCAYIRCSTLFLDLNSIVCYSAL